MQCIAPRTQFDCCFLKWPVLASPMPSGAVAPSSGIGEEKVLRFDVAMDDVQSLKHSQCTG